MDLDVYLNAIFGLFSSIMDTLGVCPCVATGVRWDEHRHISDRILYLGAFGCDEFRGAGRRAVAGGVG